MCISKLAYLMNIFSRLNDHKLSYGLMVIASIYLQSATKLMVSKEVVKKKYKNVLRNQSLVIEKNGARLSWVKTVSKKTEEEKIRIPRSNFFGNLEL